MKRQQPIKRLLAAGCVYVRPGSRRDLYMNPKTGKKQPIPRHREVDEHLARHILKILA
jgi:mRNA interferase HicA